MLSRRTLIATVPAFALAACATHPTGPTLAQKTQLVADAVQQVVADLALAGLNIPGAVVKAIQGAAADVEANANAIAAALDPKPILQQIYGDVILIGNLAAPFYPKAPQIAAAVASAIKLAADLLVELGVQPK